MTENICPDAFIYLCHNCIPNTGKIKRQWKHGNLHVKVVELPCTGKINTQYIFHALEGGSPGICVITCPLGECTLSQGNYRAVIRVNNIKHLLKEIGMEPDRVKILHFSKEDPFEKLEQDIKNILDEFNILGKSPVLT